MLKPERTAPELEQAVDSIRFESSPREEHELEQAVVVMLLVDRIKRGAELEKPLDAPVRHHLPRLRGSLALHRLLRHIGILCYAMEAHQITCGILCYAMEAHQITCGMACAVSCSAARYAVPCYGGIQGYGMLCHAMEAHKITLWYAWKHKGV